jgi:hypothetical protein
VVRKFVGPITGGVVLLCAGCAPVREPPLAPPPRGLICDKATSTVTNVGRATTSLYAQENLKHQVRDLRGDMVQAGVRRVRPVQMRTECRPAGYGALTSCTAVVRLCGR